MPEPASMEAQFAVINVKLDVLIEQRVDHEGRLRAVEDAVPSVEQQADTENRLRGLERFRWILLGAALASGPTWQAVASKLG
jgi:hypothetical protein